jgi:hypothetical protein
MGMTRSLAQGGVSELSQWPRHHVNQPRIYKPLGDLLASL